MRLSLILGVCSALLVVSAAQADVFNMGGMWNGTGPTWTGLASLEMVSVGDPGNLGELSGKSAPGGTGPDAICGGVAYSYQIGKFEVTAGQYCDFLNKVAATDTYGLYNTYMDGSLHPGWAGCEIKRSGTSGSYTYSVAADRANRPVNWVSWGDAARFTNWLNNGQPAGLQGTATTEDGSYYLNGATSVAALMNVSRKTGATWVIPTENEWYKAAYYKGGGTDSGYWDYATRSDLAPSNVGADNYTDPGNHANYYFYDNSYTLGSPYSSTMVGEFENSASAYGTFDQNGNAAEWDETATIAGQVRGYRGGSWCNDISGSLLASARLDCWPTIENNYLGFRVAMVPEPSTFGILLAGAIGLLAYASRRAGKGMHAILMLFGVLAVPAIARADVFHMGGTRDPVTGVWTGQASLEFVTVGDPGNAADTTGYGSVGYAYQMGKYDVTVGQYVEFLNAVAAADPYGLYYSGMATGMPTIGIARSGSAGTYTYTITGSYNQAANCPVFDVSWGDAARFCNWLQNGQPTGAEGPATTETGAYTLDGLVSQSALMSVTRNAGAIYFIPAQNEWYKAAYYKGGGVNAGYWAYPTQSNTPPSNILSATGMNNANFNSGTQNSQIYTDSTNHLTPVGAFAASSGPYGTYDQGGDIWQWNEAQYNSSMRVVWGGAWCYYSYNLGSFSAGSASDPTCDLNDIGFRVAAGAELLPGDANLDGIVNLNDLSTVLANYNKAGMAWSQGDFTGDGLVDINDMSNLLLNYDRSTGIKAVPEPSTLALLLAGLAGLLAFSLRGHRIMVGRSTAVSVFGSGIVLMGSLADAYTIPVTTNMQNISVGCTRTTYDGNYDLVDFYLTRMSGSSYGYAWNGIEFIAGRWTAGSTGAFWTPSTLNSLKTHSTNGWWQAPTFSTINFGSLDSSNPIWTDTASGGGRGPQTSGNLYNYFSGAWLSAGEKSANLVYPASPNYTGAGTDSTYLASLYVTSDTPTSNIGFDGQIAVSYRVPGAYGSEWLDLHIATVPEPSTIILLSTSALGLLGYAWRKRRTA